jgi:hypothetical protein
MAKMLAACGPHTPTAGIVSTGLTLKGSITKINARVTVSGDVVQALTIEVHGDFAALRDLMQKPLAISLSPDGDMALLSEEEIRALSVGE